MSAQAEKTTESFSIKIASTGETFPVPPNKSILRVLVENGYKVRSSCSDGRCGTCKTKYVGGDPDHRDTVLEVHERSDYLTVCVSRAKSAELVLDLPAPGAAQAITNPYLLDRPIAVVDQRICVACLTCVRACTFGAARIDPDELGVGGILGAAAVDMDTCTGCGLCAAACPTGAIGMTQFSDVDVNAEVREFFAAHKAQPAEPSTAPKIVAFACPNCKSAAKAHPSAGSDELDIVDMPCTGRVDNLHVMKTFEAGADGVLVTGCEPGRCNYSTGNLNADRRMGWIREWLDDVGLDGARSRMVHLPDEGATAFEEAVNALRKEIENLGPNPIRVQSNGASSAPQDKSSQTADTV